MLAGVEAGGLVRSGPAGPELRPGCLHCSPDTGTDSGAVQREKERETVLSLLVLDRDKVQPIAKLTVRIVSRF